MAVNVSQILEKNISLTDGELIKECLTAVVSDPNQPNSNWE